MNKVEVKVNAMTYGGWEEVSIQRSIRSISGTFAMKVTNLGRWPIGAGDKVEIFINNKKVISGFVDSRNRSFDGSQRTISITGRDRSGDLVDCSIVDQPMEFTKQRLVTLITNFCKKFDIKVETTVPITKVIETITIKEGETVFQFIDRAARENGFLLRSTPDGNIQITRNGMRRSNSGLEEGLNIKSGSEEESIKSIFSEYRVRGSSKDLDSPVEGKASDSQVSRYRPKLTLSESATSQESAQSQAEWEASHAASEGIKYQFSVPGWEQLDGELWDANILIPVKSPSLDLDTHLLVTDVSFKQNSSGTTTDLTLTRSDAFIPRKSIKKHKSNAVDAGWGVM